MLTVRRALIALQSICVLAVVTFTATAALGATATWDRNPEPDIRGYRLSYGTQPGVHTVSIDVGNVITYTFNPPAGTRYYVVVQAYNLAGELSAKSAEVTLDVPLPNRASTLLQPANQSSVLNAAVSMTLTASDPDGTPVTFSAKGLPPGVTINAVTGTIAGLALAKGTYPVSIAVSDGALVTAKAFTWTVTDNVSAPIVVDLRPLDTTLYLSHDNFTTADWLLAYTWPAPGVAASILMKFNLSAIPANATITSALLNMSMTSADANVSNPTYTMSLHQVMGRNPDVARATGAMADGVTAWTANQCCQGGFPMAQADISPARSRTTVDRTVGPKVFDATSVVRSWLAAPAANYGLLLNGDTSKAIDGYRMFGSMEDAVVARRPYLRVTYTVPVPAPASGGATTDSYLRIAGDFDGDGQQDLTTYRAGEWRTWTSRSGFLSMNLVNWGGIGDLPVAADYDGDRITDVGIYQPLTGSWQIRLSRTLQPLVLSWGGRINDQPSTVDADADGKADPAILRDGVYWILLSGANYTTSTTRR